MAGVELRDLGRIRQILSVLARHGFSNALSALPLHRLPGLGRVAGPEGEAGTAPRRLVAAFQELGPTFHKFGQMLSTRGDLLPRPWLEAFATLQDHVPPEAPEVARRIVEEELGVPLGDAFGRFGEVAVASASIAQVHRAELPDGTVVAVKVQRPGIDRTLKSDLAILHTLAGWIEGGIAGIADPKALVEAFDRALAQELDFVMEAQHCELLGHALTGVDGVAVPRVHRRWSGRRVLVLDWVEGRPLSSWRETGADPNMLMDRLIEATYRQIFVAGVFHGDPHPGNLFVGEGGTLWYLDFGLIGRIGPEQRDTLVAILSGIVFRDGDLLARTLYRAAKVERRIQLRELAADLQAMLDRLAGISLAGQDSGRLAIDILDLARAHGLSLPPEYAVLARAQLTLDGIARDLAPDWDMAARVEPWAARLMKERLDPGQISGEALRSAVQAAAVLKTLPGQIDQLLLDLDRGAFSIRAETPSVDRLADRLDRLGRALIFGLGVSSFLIAAAILTAALILSGSGFGVVGLALATAVGLSLLAATGLVAGLSWNLFVAGRWRGFDLRRLLPSGRREPRP